MITNEADRVELEGKASPAQVRAASLWLALGTLAFQIGCLLLGSDRIRWLGLAFLPLMVLPYVPVFLVLKFSRWGSAPLALVLIGELLAGAAGAILYVESCFHTGDMSGIVVEAAPLAQAAALIPALLLAWLTHSLRRRKAAADGDE